MRRFSFEVRLESHLAYNLNGINGTVQDTVAVSRAHLLELTGTIQLEITLPHGHVSYAESHALIE
jgi:hypothetical protein